MPAGRPGIRDLQRTLSRAADAKIAEVVSLVDAMADRGAADALVAPLRGRLQLLRPHRPLGLCRLMFMPADPVIVPGGMWRRHTPGVPRSVLACLAGQIRRGMGADAARFEAEIAGVVCDDRLRVGGIGARVWPVAGEILAQAGVPADWTDATGLAAADHAAIAGPLSVVLREATAVEGLVVAAERFGGASPGDIKACLGRAMEGVAGAGAGEGAGIGMLVAVLLARLPACAPVIIAAGDLAAARADPAARHDLDAAIGFALATGAQERGLVDVQAAAIALDRLADLLDTLERPGPACRPSARAEIAGLRQQTDAACRVRFEQDIVARMLACARGEAGDGSQDAAMAGEAIALDMRRFEAAARRFGSGAHYDRLLRQTAQVLGDSAPAGAGRIERARLVEILQGPEAGLLLFGGDG